MPHMSNDARQAFEDAVEAYLTWDTGEPEPTVELCGDDLILSQVCGLLWNCGDVLPSLLFGQVEDIAPAFEPLRRRTYAAAARMLKGLMERVPA